MTKRTRRNHTPAFKAKVALAALKGAAGVFGAGPAEASGLVPVDLKTFHAKIGRTGAGE